MLGGCGPTSGGVLGGVEISLIVTRIMLLYASGVNYNVNSNYTKYLAQRCCLNFAFWKILLSSTAVTN